MESCNFATNIRKRYLCCFCDFFCKGLSGGQQGEGRGLLEVAPPVCLYSKQGLDKILKASATQSSPPPYPRGARTLPPPPIRGGSMKSWPVQDKWALIDFARLPRITLQRLQLSYLGPNLSRLSSLSLDLRTPTFARCVEDGRPT